MSKLLNQLSLDLVSSVPTTTVNFNLGTTPVKIADYTPATGSFGAKPAGIRLLCITNKHATNLMAVGFSTNTSSPTFAAAAAGTTATTEGMPILANSQLFINVKADISVWVVASAGSTPFQVTAFDRSLGMGG